MKRFLATVAAVLMFAAPVMAAVGDPMPDWGAPGMAIVGTEEYECSESGETIFLGYLVNITYQDPKDADVAEGWLVVFLSSDPDDTEPFLTGVLHAKGDAVLDTYVAVDLNRDGKVDEEYRSNDAFLAKYERGACQIAEVIRAK